MHQYEYLKITLNNNNKEWQITAVNITTDNIRILKKWKKSEIEMSRITIVCLLKTTKWQNLTREDQEIA